MEISIRSRNVEVTDGLREAITEKVARAGRFLDGMERAEVTFSEERNPRIPEKEVCEVTMHGHGHIVRAKAAASDPLAAVDRVVDKLEHRLERLKGRLVGRSHPRRYSPPGPLDSGPAGTRRTSAIASDPDDDADEGHARIVKTKRFAMKPMTPEEAALQMDLLGHDFFFFSNAETGAPAVVYRRNDGDVGLIDAT